MSFKELFMTKSSLESSSLQTPFFRGESKSCVLSCRGMGADNHGAFFYVVSDSTANIALDRIEGKRALDLREEIERYKIITTSIERALKELKQQEMDFVQYRYFEYLPIQAVKQRLGYSEDKSIYRIRRHVLDKLLISLNNLLSFK